MVIYKYIHTERKKDINIDFHAYSDWNPMVKKFKFKLDKRRELLNYYLLNYWTAKTKVGLVWICLQLVIL